MKVPPLLCIAVLATALSLAAVGCSDEVTTAPQPAASRTGIAGSWQGRLGASPLRLDISEAEDRSLVGEVTLGGGEDARRFTIVGTAWSGPSTFSLFLDYEDDRIRTLRGTVSDDRVYGDYSETGDTGGTRTDWEANRLRTIAPL